MSTGPTTLEEELRNTSYDIQIYADMGEKLGLYGLARQVRERSERLRQRAAHRERVMSEALALEEPFRDVIIAWLLRLTGPIPAAETAPTERKEP